MQREPLTEFRECLKQNGLKITPERIAVFEEISKSNEHFEADELYIRLRRRRKRVSRATVYRTLDLLVENGFVSKVNVGSTMTKYERAIGEKHHGHLVCTECGAIAEFHDTIIEQRQGAICRENSFMPTKHNLIIFGLCGECQKRKS